MNLFTKLRLLLTPLLVKKLFEMNRVISDTAEYGCYLFDQACKPLLGDFMKTVDTDLVGKISTKEKTVLWTMQL